MDGLSRRAFFGTAALAAATPLSTRANAVERREIAGTAGDDFVQHLAAAETSPILAVERITAPAIVEDVALLRRDDQFFVRIRDRDGVEGITLCNPRLMASAWPIFLERVAPFFKGKDLRQLEDIQRDLYVWKLNYKWQGLAFWCVHAWMEFAALDLLGNKSGLPVSELLGGRVRDRTAIYYASGNRGNAPEAEIAYLQTLVAKAGAKAVKFRLGARMRHDDASTARDLALIPGVRKHFGDSMVLYADANSSYDVPLAIKIGRLLEDYSYGFYEEPVRFDHYEELCVVSKALKVPIAVGEQEVSMRRFRWLVEEDVAQILQPDLLFNGGMIRALRVARMAAVRSYPCVPHMSGGGLGSLYVTHFAGVCANTTEYQEYKGEESVPHEIVGTGRPLTVKNGEVEVPKGPGLGVFFDPDYLKGAAVVRASFGPSEH
jgi:L-alanine-DL-glutamate epimerase-like enolase superfamily enzyme